MTRHARTRDQKVDDVAKLFFAKIVSGEQYDNTAHPAKALARAAFALYAESWAPFDITHWEWPFNTLDRREPFDGEEPWTVLLRRAVQLAERP